jgi:hypothetical protein
MLFIFLCSAFPNVIQYFASPTVEAVGLALGKAAPEFSLWNFRI